MPTGTIVTSEEISSPVIAKPARFAGDAIGATATGPLASLWTRGRLTKTPS